MGEFVCDKVLIGGAWVPAERGTYAIVDPATEETAGRAPECSVAQAEGAGEVGVSDVGDRLGGQELRGA